MNREEKYLYGERVTWVGIVVNALLGAVKLLAGLLGRSEALIADAAHSLSDLFTDLVVLVSLKISKRPIDEARPYGYGRVETVGTGVLGIILMIAGAGIFLDALVTIRRGVDYVPTYAAPAGAVLSIIIKEAIYQYTVRAGRKIGSTAIIANAWHHRSDALSSVASLVGVWAAMMGWPLFDPLAAIIVTFLIMQVGVKITRDAFMDIIDTSVKKEIRDKIIDAAREIPGALNCHELKTRKIGSEILVDIHVEVNPWMNVHEAHSIADEVKESIMKSVRNIADVLVHIDPEGELNGITYSIPREKVMEDIENLAMATEGIKNCSDIRLHYIGNDIIANLTVELSPKLSIKEGYARVSEVKRKVLELERVKDAVINVDLSKE